MDEAHAAVNDVSQENLVDRANELQEQQQPDDLEDVDADEDPANENQQPEQNAVLLPEMMLTPQEHAEAWHIKETIEGICPDIDNLSDFMYGALAIVVEGDMDRALDIATHMQNFRMEYDILDTLEDGLRHMENICGKQTDGNRCILAIDEDTEGTFIVTNDLPKLDLRNYKSPQQIQRFFKGFYYLNMAISPDFRALKGGATNLIECEGYKWKNNMMDVDFMKQVFRNGAATFPIKMQRTMFFNSPMLVNTMVSTAKTVLPKHMAKTIQVGCRAPGGERLDQLYNIPSTEVAEERLKAKIEDLLQRRYRNERTYRLYDQALEEEEDGDEVEDEDEEEDEEADEEMQQE